MSVQCRKIVNWIEEWAPTYLAQDWDHMGMQVGKPDAVIEKLVVTLEATAAVVDEAISTPAQMIVSHHPLFHKPLMDLSEDHYPANLAVKMVRHGISFYAAHTTLDAAAGGINDILANMLKLQDTEILAPVGGGDYFKLVVYVPQGYEDRVLSAICAQGAGGIGNYTECTFQTEGTGTYRPQAGSHPFRGEAGKLERAPEVRLETIVPADRVAQVIQSMRQAHPYEEPAYDLYPLRQSGVRQGLGRVGQLPKPMLLTDFARMVKGLLSIQTIKITGDPERMISRVALCGGAAIEFLPLARASGAELYLTADVKHHEALDAAAQGMAIIDAGHYGIEYIIVPALADYLKQRAQQVGVVLDVRTTGVKTDPFWYI
jgi:dinuclear metal center YbgI/SA1388 family protein